MHNAAVQVPVHVGPGADNVGGRVRALFSHFGSQDMNELQDQKDVLVQSLTFTAFVSFDQHVCYQSVT